MKRKYQNCINRGIVLRELDYDYNKILNNENKIRKFDINDYDIQNINTEIINLNNRIDEKEEDYNKLTKKLLNEIKIILYVI